MSKFSDQINEWFADKDNDIIKNVDVIYKNWFDFVKNIVVMSALIIIYNNTNSIFALIALIICYIILFLFLLNKFLSLNEHFKEKGDDAAYPFNLPIDLNFVTPIIGLIIFIVLIVAFYFLHLELSTNFIVSKH